MEDRLDISSEPAHSKPPLPSENRPYLGVNFACCGVYARVYRNASGTAYVGHCPRCTRRVQINIAPGGSSERFFTVY